MLFLVESFYSFQGEGKFAGTPSIFIRLGGCNLGCVGFGVETISPKDNSIIVGCDSIRAVHHEHFSQEWHKIEFKEALISEIDQYLEDLNFKPDIVFTGGEPLLHHENSILIDTISHFIELGHRVTFESNATIFIDFEKYPIYKKVIFAMSVKLKNSGEARNKRINFKAIKSIVNNTKESFFKFVLSSSDVNTHEISEISSHFVDTPIYCMPMGSTAKELAQNDKAVALFCIRKGYSYVDRMHIRLWDNEEGR